MTKPEPEVEQEAKALKESVKLFNKPQVPRIGTEFNDVNGIFKSLYNKIPKVSSEMIYKMEIHKTLRIYQFLMFLGFLLSLTMIIYSI